VGSRFKYKCSKFNYEVLTSSLKDYSVLAVVKPYICSDCKIITDISIGEFGKVIRKDKLTKDQNYFYKCPECKGTNINVWNTTKKPCPKCSGKMFKVSDDPEILWD